LREAKRREERNEKSDDTSSQVSVMDGIKVFNITVFGKHTHKKNGIILSTKYVISSCKITKDAGFV
jgi:hypothetical protein